MSSVNIFWKHHASYQIQSFVKFMHENRYSDCILLADGKVIYAHKIILASASPVFLELFQFTQFIPSIIHVVNDVKFHDLHNFIEFLYSGSIRLQKYQVKRFIILCKIFKIKGIDEMEGILIKTAIQNQLLKKSPKRLTNKCYGIKKKLSPRQNTTKEAFGNCSETSKNWKQFSFYKNTRRSLNFNVEPMDTD